MSDRPNIVFIISDHHRFDYMGCAGSSSIQTPNMDRLAENGTRITGMHCNVPLCVPSRIAISTGRYPARTGCWRSRCVFAAGESDMLIGRVMKSLEKNGMLENTIVVYTSDHGDMVEDHGAKGKTVMYEGSIRVPFIASGPGIPKGRVVETLAELFDVGKTFCDFAGVESHPYDQGESMKLVLTGEADVHREDVFAEMGSDKMIRDGKYKLMYGDFMREDRADYTEDPFGEHQKRQRPVTLMPDKVSLYDLENDPWEERDLSDDPAHQNVLWEMKEKLMQRMIRNSQAIV